VRAFFTENVLYWLMEYRFDGLRFDAVHAIEEQDWVDEMASAVRATVGPDRHVHLVLEHHNDVSHLEKDIDAQWNDDGHNVLHVMLTGEDRGYYADYAERPAAQLARCLAEGFVFQGERSRYLDAPRGMPSAHLPPTAFVLFLQNHDQIGNRAFGERLTILTDPAALEAAIALLMLSPQIPMLFMGEETASRTPFLFFTDHRAELADAVREGRRNEFAHFPAFADPAMRERIPDPNAAKTFEASVPHPDPTLGHEREALYRHLLVLRRTEIVPRLDCARSLDARAVGAGSVVARWRLGDGALLTIACNLGTTLASIPPPVGQLLFASIADGSARVAPGQLPGHCTYAFLDVDCAAHE
jgi:maltooligosyltrehalose trehalohydrolase